MSTHGYATGPLALHVDKDGKPRYDAVVHQGRRPGQRVQSTFQDLVPLSERSDAQDQKRSLDRPSEQEVQSTAERTRAALEKIVQGKIRSTQPSNVAASGGSSSYIRYTPAQQGAGERKQRIIKMTEVAEDPLEPPRHRFRKIPGGPPSPPPPVLRSPPRKVTAQEQKEWMIPPCISNWKNNKGYTIPLDKRLAADGRGLQDVYINDNFAQFSEALHLADRHAREEVRERNIMQQKIAAKEKAEREESLRMLAQRARTERGGTDDRDGGLPAALAGYGSSDSEEDEEAAERDRLREERRRERERDLRMSNMGNEQRARAYAREQNRDISEKVALGLAKPTLSKESMTDARLFNREALSNSFGDEDSYNVYDKPLFHGSSAAAAIYRRPGGGSADDIYGGGTEEGIAQELEHDRFGLGKTKSFAGAEHQQQRDGPVQFEKDESDPFAINQFLDDAKRGVKRAGLEDPSASKRAPIRSWIDGFKPAIQETDELPHTLPEKYVETETLKSSQNSGEKGHVMVEDHATSGKALKKTLSTRHIAFIALGSGIGTGLFIGSGSKLALAGPAPLIIDYGIVGLMMVLVIASLGELAAVIPVTGAFSTYATRFLDPAWGFAVGYNYWMQWLVTLPLEYTAASIVIQFWDTKEVVPRGVWIAIFTLLMILVNFFGAKGYGEFEFMATLLKILTVVGFIIVGIYIDCGGPSAVDYIGGRYWHDPGAFNHGFKGVCAVFTTAAFAFQGTELVGLAASETRSPRRALPKACFLVFLRVIIFYVVPLLLVGLIIPYTEPGLVGSQKNDPNTSPFVLSLRIAQIKALPSIVNAVITVSTLSVANSSIYGSSRTLHALADQGLAPSFLRYVDREGRPLFSVIISLLFGLLGFLIYSGSQGVVFNWLLGISGLSSIFTWGSTCLAHIRFRAAWAKRGYSAKDLPWASPFGVYGSWAAFIVNVLILCANFYVSAFPTNEGELSPQDRAYEFFLGMISLPIVIFLYFTFKIVWRTKIVSLEDMDIDSGRRLAPSQEMLDQERAEFMAQPAWRRFIDTIF
ncbi:hypothetical protein MCUN1_003734 [Malassezia cuniculi]|uniref:Pre-mRNA-processing protein 45 n=1 Tax=Malassezia cuniculi TaxID=948313 RepID=A0AAF0EYJ9_9BASI|nr:hypothetical protein MCUN1_003734 [Malassezia cuniculi]